MKLSYDEKKLAQWQALTEYKRDTFKTASSDVYRDICGIIEESTLKNFSEKGRPQTWARRKHENRYWWPCLQKTLNMKNKTLDYIRKGFKRAGDRLKLLIYSASYGVYHQYGENDMHRPFVTLQADELTAIADRIKEELKL